MNIRAAQSADATESSVYIYSDLKELESLELSKSELAYVENSIKDNDFKTCTLNRFPRFVYLVKVSSKNLSKDQYQEKIRIQAVHCAKMLEVRKDDKVTISSLSS